MIRRRQKKTRWLRAVAIAALLWLGLIGLPAVNSIGQWGEPLGSSSLSLPSALAQRRLNERELWRQIYEQLPDLPLENHYVSRRTGDVSADNTLISRLIRYHVYIKNRPSTYRLDWKLTLADYLGANELMIASTYPGADTLRQNPMAGDIAAIKQLNRVQRDALVQALVDLFQPPQAIAPPSPIPSPSPSPTPEPTPTPFREPRPGDAQLLGPAL